MRLSEIRELVDRTVNAIEKAQRADTLGKVDRSKQYQPPLDECTLERVLQHLNGIGTTLRTLQSSKDREIGKLRKEFADRIESRIWHRIMIGLATAEFTLIVALLVKLASR